MHRTGVRRFGTTLVVAVVLALAVGFFVGRAAAGPTHVERRVYVVRAGDTLWGIASRMVGPEGDPRPAVDELAAANGLPGPLIVPGQRLVLPAVGG